MTATRCPASGSLKQSLSWWIALANASYETQKVEGHWRHGGVLYRDVLVRLVVDVPDSSDHRNWIKEFKARWRVKLKQLELRVVSYRIDIE